MHLAQLLPSISYAVKSGREIANGDGIRGPFNFSSDYQFWCPVGLAVVANRRSSQPIALGHGQNVKPELGSGAAVNYEAHIMSITRVHVSQSDGLT